MERELIKQKVMEVIEDTTDILREEMSEEDALMDDLDVSSLEILTIIGEIEEVFDIKVDKKEMRDIVTIGDVIDHIYNTLN